MSRPPSPSFNLELLAAWLALAAECGVNGVFHVPFCWFPFQDQALGTSETAPRNKRQKVQKPGGVGLLYFDREG